ncbi:MULTISPECIES: co-chaperone YbbN [Lactobacillus]|uniref:thioredoxin family protein n=1 Tax=Lactobacillus TaxID=1578 RepID=UPI001F316809|nr:MULTISPECIES: thioredoxin family protein [Lactobacillus]
MQTLTRNKIATLPPNAVLYFDNDWCSQCYSENKVVTEIEKVVGETVPFFEVNVTEFPELASKYQVLSAPSLVLLKNGQKVDQFSKFLDQNQFKAVFQYYFGALQH